MWSIEISSKNQNARSSYHSLSSEGAKSHGISNKKKRNKAKRSLGTVLVLIAKCNTILYLYQIHQDKSETRWMRGEKISRQNKNITAETSNTKITPKLTNRTSLNKGASYLEYPPMPDTSLAAIHHDL